MKAEDSINRLEDKTFLDKLYGFAYRRCSSSHEAEDLCADIILALLKSIRKNSCIENFYAFAWTVANRAYADYCEKRKVKNDSVSMEKCPEEAIYAQTNDIDAYIESETEAEQLNRIMREIAFLSKIYRDVMVLYYIDELKTSEISKRLSISETAVKQRLFSARNTIKKEVNKMESNSLVLKPIRIDFIGTGNPVGNDPREKAERAFSQNLVYLCKDTARSAKELSELLNVPMPFIEEELEIQCHGANGQYGLLRKTDNGKYISNIIIVDREDFAKADAVYKQGADMIVAQLEKYLEQNRERILYFPFLNPQSDLKFITWSLISRMIWGYEGNVQKTIKEKYFADIQILKREFSAFGIATKCGQDNNYGFYGCDGNTAYNCCGYAMVFFVNIYGKRIEKHFSCGHNITGDPLLQMTVKAIEGIPVDTLSADEKETAAKAIEVGYLKKENNTLFPKILVLYKKDEQAFYDLSNDFARELEELSQSTARSIAELVKCSVPKHLMNEYDQFALQATWGLLNDVFEKCIGKGLLDVPATKPCAEGTWMIIGNL